MPVVFRIGVCAAALLLGVIVYWLARCDRLHPASAGWWLGWAALLLAWGVAPGLLAAPARGMGLSGPLDAFLLFAVALLFLRALYVDVRRTRGELRLRRLIGRQARLDLRLRELERTLAARDAASPEPGEAAGGNAPRPGG